MGHINGDRWHAAGSLLSHDADGLKLMSKLWSMHWLSYVLLQPTASSRTLDGTSSTTHCTTRHGNLPKQDRCYIPMAPACAFRIPTLRTISFASFSCIFQVLRKASVARPVGRESRATGRNNHNFEFLLTKKQEQYLFCPCQWRIWCLQLRAVRELPLAQFQLAGAVGRKSRATERATNQSRRKMRNGAQFKFCSGRVGVRKHGSEVFWS